MDFWSKVDKKGPDDCWEWLGFISRKGYGHGYFGKGEPRLVHKYSFLIHNGYIPVHPRIVSHSCHNKPCVNPSHLIDNSQSGCKSNYPTRIIKGLTGPEVFFSPIEE